MATLGVFFTRGVGIESWYKAGLLDRELLIYEEHLRRNTFECIYFFTYGVTDIQLTKKLIEENLFPAHGIKVMPPPAWIKRFSRAGSAIYCILLPLLFHREPLRKCDVYKTNQMEGSIAAIMARFVYGKPLYVRTGYTLSRIVNKLFSRNILRKWFAYLTEWIAFKFSEQASVSSQFDLDYIVEKYDLHARPPALMGNYVDVELFSPSNSLQTSFKRFLFVGRLSPEKNLDNAIIACATLGIGLDIVGDGSEKKKLEHLVKLYAADVNWLGKLPNRELPNLLRQYRYFLLPSLWEGLPKALMEAMAAGLVCVGTDVTGIRELIEDNVTGFLAQDTSPKAIEKALTAALECDTRKITEAARSLICQDFSLDAVVTAETNIFQILLTENTNHGAANYTH